MIQEYLQPKIGRKIRIFSLRQNSGKKKNKTKQDWQQQQQLATSNRTVKEGKTQGAINILRLSFITKENLE